MSVSNQLLATASMTSTVSPVTIATLLGNDYSVISASIGLVAILLLAILLAQKELWRARGAPARVLGAFDVASVPLLMAAVVVLGLRLIDLLV